MKQGIRSLFTDRLRSFFLILELLILEAITEAVRRRP